MRKLIAGVACLVLCLLHSTISAQSYAALWKQEQKLENEGKPQSAYSTTQTILHKALAEGNQGQALSARMRAVGLHQEWAPDSFFTDVAELESLRQAASQPEARAIYASILAQVYEDNRRRSQANSLVLTSDDMREWTREQYDSAALANWELSLQPLDALHKARTSDWLPFVKQSDGSAYYGHDLLHVLWQRYRNQATRTWKNNVSQRDAHADAIVAIYKADGNRNAALLTELDKDNDQNDLLALRDAYSDLPLCAEVYHALTQREASDSQRVAWAEEALQRYPRYERIDALRNVLNNLHQPSVSWSGQQVCYPQKDYTWNLKAQNVTSITVQVLRLPDSFNDKQLNNQKHPDAYLRKIGRKVQELSCTFTKAEPYQTIEDSIIWQAPEIGYYALLYSATTQEKESTNKQMQGQYDIIRVTRLVQMYQKVDDTLYAIVVDAESGQPVQDATVALLREDDERDEMHIMKTARTDAEGRAQLTIDPSSRSTIYLRATKGEDVFLPEQALWARYSSSRPETEETVLHLYTDRAIYRPGQTVHLGGIAYSKLHWDASTVANKEYELILRDANWKEVGRQTVTTDSLGVISADFVLPVGHLPGVWRVRAANSSVTFRVEEYKRPTFEVRLDEAPALQWPQDSITLSGRAIGYNGVPVRDARVTAHYQFVYQRFWWYSHEDSPRLPLDTVRTDEQGRFSLNIPLKDIPEEALRWGLHLKLDAEVLNAAGETHEASSRTSLCTTPLRLSITMAEMLDRDRLTTPAFSLITSTGKPAAGTITWLIAPVSNGSAGSAADSPSGTITLPSPSLDSLMATLRALSSGEYELRAFAQAGNDTASARQKFVVFGMDDTHPVCNQDLWLYCPTDTFSHNHSALLQVGSSRNDAALYYSIFANKIIVKQGLMRLSNELRQMELPYSDEYGDGLTIHFALVKDGKAFTKAQILRLAMPDNELRWKWTSFRDRVHAGDTETWTLHITRPDGTPAPANLMATIYDASLDAITPHLWRLMVSRFHSISSRPWNVVTGRSFLANGNYYFPMRSYDVPMLAFDAFNAQYFDGIGYSDVYYSVYNTNVRVRGTRPMMMKASRANGVAAIEQMAVADEANMLVEAPAPMAAGINESAEEESADDDEAGNDAGETIDDASSSVRTNFNETAYFAPRLRTDADGNVTLQFTLPQSLTTWRMMGIAHTADVQTASIEAKTVASKELMAHLYMPRFLRSGDEGSISAAIQNLSEQSLTGKARLEIYDPETGRVLSKQQSSFNVVAKGEAVCTFAYTPEDLPTIVAVRLTAETKDFSDGEQYLLPVLPNKTYVTESVEIEAVGIGTFTTDLSSLFNHDAASATNRTLTVEYTTHPIWTVVQSLPALRNPQNDDVLSLTTAFYANALAAHILATTPRLREVMELWDVQRQRGGVQGLNSPLEDDEDLKQLVLDETPWLRDAMKDSERMAELSSLFNSDMLATTLGSTLQRLEERQEHDGGFSWFPGMRSSEMMTRLVAIYLTQLRSLTNEFESLSDNEKQHVNIILRKAVAFVARENARGVKEMKEAEARGEIIHTGSLMHLHYIYISQRSGVKLTSTQQADVRYLLDHLDGTVASMNNMERAVAAIVLKGAGRNSWHGYYDSMKEHLTVTTKHGSFFDYAGGSFVPTNHKLIAHTSAMEAVAVVDADNSTLQSGLRRWLLQQKRAQMWESNICTINAIYALLHNNSAEILEKTADELSLRYRKRTVKVQSTQPSAAALGYIKESYTDGQVPQSITVNRHSTSEAWGAVYASYLTPYADVTASSTGLSVRRELSNANPQLGERVTTRFVITADRDYEYVCLRAERAACAEPAIMRSGYHFQGGLGYYMAMHDAHTDYFFDHLPKGTYVLEETSYIDRPGQYTTGLVRIQCLYAPEFGGVTTSQKLNTKTQK